jgi:alpha-1,2-mannosyltransferase
VASVAAHLVVARANPHLWQMLDLDVYRWGGSSALDGRDLYEGVQGGLSFTYPPFAASAFVPFAAVSMDTSRWILTALSITALFGSVFLTLRAVSDAGTRARVAATLLIGGVALWFEPVQQTLSYGQINLVLLAILLADLLQPDGRRWKGAGVGVAAGLKLTPAVFVVYLLVTGRRRAAAVATTAGAATVALGFAVLPSASWDFWGGADSSRRGASATSATSRTSRSTA